MNLSVCINTYRRSDRLELLLEDMCRQELLPQQVVVVDNDAEGSARPVVERRRSEGAPFRLDYDIQPLRNIARTRNRTVQLAEGEWLAFVDDDERAPPEWLRLLLAAAAQYQADGVLAPVQPDLPPDAPRWIRGGRFYDFPCPTSGAVIPLNQMRFGNVLLRAHWLRSEPGPFDERYGLMTGEDGDLLVRLVHRGARIVSCREAFVREPIERKRMSLRWLMRRAFSGGQEFARQTLRGRYGRMSGPRAGLFLCRATLQLCAAALLTIIVLPAGLHRAAAWCIRTWANLGKLSVLWGDRFEAYR
jgi:succinoglycan biosynthesis protein ExoM